MTSEDIQHEIERTRGEMATTLQAIEQRLSPRQLMDQAVDTMRELASDNRVGQAVRENPIPLALIGLGLGWLAISGVRSRREGMIDIEPEEESAWSGTAGVEDYSRSDYTAGTAGYGAGAATASTAGYGIEASRGDGKGQRLKGRASELAGQAKDRMSQARDRVSQTAETAKMRMNEWSRNARATAGQAADRTWEAYQQHPLTMGLVAVLMGAALGAMLPRTRKEQEMMGGAAQDLMRATRETGSELMDKASRVAGRAVESAKQEAKESMREEQGRSGLSEGGPAGSTTSTMTH